MGQQYFFLSNLTLAYLPSSSRGSSRAMPWKRGCRRKTLRSLNKISAISLTFSRIKNNNCWRTRHLPGESGEYAPEEGGGPLAGQQTPGRDQSTHGLAGGLESEDAIFSPENILEKHSSRI